MIREILEQQLHMFEVEVVDNHCTDCDTIILKCAKSKRNYKFTGFVYEFYRMSIDKYNEDKIEIACRQYVKEYGFKLEWFGKVVCWSDNDNKKYIQTKDLQYILAIVESVKIVELGKTAPIPKLIAWLYANDIEVVE